MCQGWEILEDELTLTLDRNRLQTSPKGLSSLLTQWLFTYHFYMHLLLGLGASQSPIITMPFLRDWKKSTAK